MGGTDFDIGRIKAISKDLLKKGGSGIENARKLFEETVFEWADDYSRIIEETPQLSIEVSRKAIYNNHAECVMIDDD